MTYEVGQRWLSPDRVECRIVAKTHHPATGTLQGVFYTRADEFGYEHLIDVIEMHPDMGWQRIEAD